MVMSTIESPATGNGFLQHHEQPFLFNWNRRLRNLHGILLRNVRTSPVNSRPRGKTTTDDEAPYNLETPTKRALKNENRGLSHSHSFTSLATSAGSTSATTTRTSRQHPPPTPSKETGLSHLETKPETKSPTHHNTAGLRSRRATQQWHAASAATPQQQKVAAGGLPDTWFSLHSKNKDLKEPIYVSEVMEKSINPSFAFFDLDKTEPAVSRADECIVRVWAREADADADDWRLLLEVDVNLRSLQFIGRSLDTFYHPLPPNCVLFQLSDGIYTAFTDLPADLRKQARQEHKSGSAESTSSFDALMQLANLDDCIQDALKVRGQLEEEVNELLQQSHAHRSLARALVSEKEKHANVYNAVQLLRRQTAQLKRRKADLAASLDARRAAIRHAHANADSQLRLRERQEAELRARQEAHAQLADQSTGQMRRISEDLLAIFPIEPLQAKPLHFTIRQLYLPNSIFDDTNRDTIAAALGFAAQLVHSLSLYLATPLPYPLESRGGTSFVHDPISMGLAQREYALHPSSVGYKFEYAVFLLNKDIEFLMNRVNLRALDIRHTLPNLKYLLYILTAGSGDLPARKTGGIRGLLGGGRGLSRQSSQDSALGARQVQAQALARAQATAKPASAGNGSLGLTGVTGES